MSQRKRTAGTIERALRHHLTNTSDASQSPAAQAAGWDSSAVSRVLSGQQGVTIGKIDALVNSAGYVLVSQRYFDAIGTLGEVGMHCQCARNGGGECGPGSQPLMQISEPERGHA